MLPKIAVFNGNVFIPVISSTSICVYEFCYNHSKSNGYFVQKKCYKTELDEHLDILWYGVVTTSSHITNMLMVFLLLHNRNGQLEIFCCMQKKFACFLQKISSHFFPIDNGLDILITEGITVLTVNKSLISLIHPFYKIEKTYDLTQFATKHDCHFKLSLFQCVENNLKSKKFSVFYIFAVSTNTTVNNKAVHLFGWVWDSANQTVNDKLFLIPLRHFFPEHFQQSLSALQIVFSNINFLKHMYEGTPINDIPWSENKTITCINTEFVIFLKGRMAYKCEIPFTNVDRLVLPKLHFNTINNAFLESWGHGVCLLMYKSQEDQIKCSKTWMNSQHALPGDFYKNGSKQVLIIFDDSYECWQVGCSVIQLNSFSESLHEEINIPDSHLTTTVTALSKKATAGSAAIVDAYYKIAEKTAEMAIMFKKIANVPAEADTQFENGGLIDLILKKDKAEEMCPDTHAKTEPLALKVISQWKVFLFNQWILGWTLINISKSTITNANVTISSSSQELEYFQKAFKQDIHAVDLHCVEPGKRMSIVSVIKTAMPLVHEVIELPCVLSWSVGRHFRNNLLFSDEISLPCQQIAYQLILNMQDVLTKNLFCELPGEQQLMTLRVLQEQVLLRIESEASDLSEFDEFVCKSKLNFKKVQDREKEHFILEDATLLFGVNMTAKVENHRSIQLEVYVKDVSEAVIFTQWLYSILPSDVAICPQETSVEKLLEHQKKLLAAMKDEVELLKAFSANPSIDLEREIETIDDLEFQKITHSRDLFLQMRRTLLKRELVTDNVMKEFVHILHVRD